VNVDLHGASGRKEPQEEGGDGEERRITRCSIVIGDDGSQ